MSVHPQKIAFESSYTIWDIVRRFHVFWRIFGFANFSVDGSIENGKIHFKLMDALIAVISNGLVLYIMYLNYFLNLTLITPKSRIIAMGSRLVLLYEICNVFVASVTTTARKNHVWGIFGRCYKLDEEIKTIGMQIDHRKQLQNMLVAFGLCAVVFVCLKGATGYFMFELVAPEKVWFFLISYTIISLSKTIVLLTASFILYFIYIRFRLINDSIKNFFVTEEEDELKVQKPSVVLCKIVAKLADVHDSLVDVVNSFNYCFAFTLMNLVAAMFLTNIFSIFAVYRVFVRFDYSQYGLSIIQYVWNFYFLIYGFFIVMLGSLVTRTGKYTAVLVHKAVNYVVDDDDPVIDVLKMFSQQMQHRAPVVTCGLFTFDFTLVFTIIGATATYIVILIQFDTDVPAPNNNSTDIFANLSFITPQTEF